MVRYELSTVYSKLAMPLMRLSRRKLGLGSIFVPALLLVLTGCSKSNDSKPSTNVLAIGPASQAPQRVDVSMVASASLNGQSLEQILDARTSIVQQNVKLLTSDYQPTKFLYSRLDQGVDWESLRATYFDGPSKMCGSGPSTESTAILNPFLLVSARFFWQPFWEGKISWGTEKVPAQKVDSPEFPLYMKAQLLTWFPKESRAEVAYDLSDYLKRVEPYIKDGLTISDASFSLHPANARDFQMRYMYLDPERSSNITFPKLGQKEIKLTDSVRPRKFRETTVVCNGGGFPPRNISGIRVSALPARLNISLWRQKPANVTDSPNMTFVIHID